MLFIGLIPVIKIDSVSIAKFKLKVIYFRLLKKKEQID